MLVPYRVAMHRMASKVAPQIFICPCTEGILLCKGSFVFAQAFEERATMKTILLKEPMATLFGRMLKTI